MPRPFSFYLASLLLVGMTAEMLVRRRREPWLIPGLMVMLTTFGWYFVDPFMTPESYEFLPEPIVSASYWQICLFLVVFRLLLPRTVRWIVNLRTVSQPTAAAGGAFTPTQFFYLLAGAWAVLVAFGLYRMEGDIFATFFPLDGRAGTQMWGRPAAGDAGKLGFLVSAGSYCHLLVSAFLGVTVFFLRSLMLRLVNVALILVAWPYFLLMGARSMFLAVVLPMFLCYLLFSRQPFSMRVALLLVAVLGLDFAFRIIVNYRGVGFRGLMSDTGERQEMMETKMEQTGLNMIQELCFINIYSRVGQHEPEWGGGYLADLAGVIPRAIWPNKPLLGIEYAKWRGFEGGDSDIGVVATISMGFIGGGIMNFGPLLGPLAPAIILALWCGVLARWWTQRGSILRLCLFLAGAGVTFNLGRDLTLLVVWPLVFGYAGVRALEWISARPAGRARSGGGRARLVPVPLRPWEVLTTSTLAAPGPAGLTASAASSPVAADARAVFAGLHPAVPERRP